MGYQLLIHRIAARTLSGPSWQRALPDFTPDHRNEAGLFLCITLTPCGSSTAAFCSGYKLSLCTNEAKTTSSSFWWMVFDYSLETICAILLRGMMWHHVSVDLFEIQEIFLIFSKRIKVTATQFCLSTMLCLDITASLLSILKIQKMKPPKCVAPTQKEQITIICHNTSQ